MRERKRREGVRRDERERKKIEGDERRGEKQRTHAHQRRHRVHRAEHQPQLGAGDPATLHYPLEQSTPDGLDRTRTPCEFYPIDLDAPGLRTCGEPLDETKKEHPGQDQWESPHRSARVTHEQRSSPSESRGKPKDKNIASRSRRPKGPRPDRTKQNHKTARRTRKTPGPLYTDREPRSEANSFENSGVPDTLQRT